MLLHHFKATSEFKLELQSGNALFRWVKIGNFLSRVTLKFDGWPWEKIGHLFYVVSSFVYHFIAISEFNLELQSGNAQFGSKSMFFLFSETLKFRQMTLENNRAPLLGQNRRFFSCVTLKFDGWPWKTIGQLLCYFKLCLSFRSHWWLQTGVTVRKRSIWVKIDAFLAMWPWNLTDDLEKQ